MARILEDDVSFVETCEWGCTLMEEIAALLIGMRELEPEVYVYGQATEERIRELEEVFGQPMPPSYREFLAKFGAFSIIDSSYSGIIDNTIEDGRGWAWSDTKLAREWCQLPIHFLVVKPDEDGFTCLDFSRIRADGEHPVVYHMPFRRTPFNEMGTSYKEWLTKDLQAIIAVRAEDATPRNSIH
jgi:hypothetical protein